ncbi:MAG: hypothetical protein J6T22_05305 [Bacteroidales bacterium]|jgi:hypothetical protein|nr:hypothetical protein [Bacteroidales bacterium]
MKKKNLILMAFAIMVVAIPFIQGCEKKKNCYYGHDGIVYNPSTNDCECVNHFEGMELDTGYNAWLDVVHYMQYYSRDDKPNYPYYSREGDTVKTCGWINHLDGQTLLPNESDSLYVQFEISDDSLAAMNAKRLSAPTHIEGDLALFDGIDRDKKCYLKGIITFHQQADYLYWLDGPADPEPSHNCSSANFALRLVEIRN